MVGRSRLRLLGSGCMDRLRRAGRWRAGRWRADDGVATVFACLCAMALLTVTIVALQLGAATVARHRAEVAADLGALAGAARVLDGEPAACHTATAIARANHATVTDCSLDRLDVLLTVSVDVHFGPLASTATGRARAGPVAQ